MFISDLISQLCKLFNSLPAYLLKSPISSVFLVYLLSLFILSVLNYILTYIDAKKDLKGEKCMYLKESPDGLYCSNRIHRKRFASNSKSCDGCHGKTGNIIREEAENKFASTSVFAKTLVTLTRFLKSVFPYISFVYTLSIAVFKTT